MFDKYKGKTFAQISKVIDKKYPARETDNAQRNAFQAEMSALMQKQEEMKAIAQPQNDGSSFAFGGGLTQAMRNASPYMTGAQLMSDTPITTYPTTGMLPRQDGIVNPIQSGAEAQMNPIPGGRARVTPMLPSKQSYDMGDPELPMIQIGEQFSASDPPTPFGQTKVGNYLQDNIYAPVAIGKGLEFAAKAFQLADGYDTVDPELNPNSSRIRQIMGDRRINLDAVRNDALSGYNANVEGANPVRSQAVRQSIIQNAGNSLTGAMSSASLSEQQANNQYRAEEAQSLDSLGQQEVAARNYTEQLNNQSKAGYQQSLQNLFTSVGNAGQELTNFRAGIAQQQLLAETLRTANFQFGDAKDTLRNAARNGEMTMDDIIKVVDYADKGASKADIEAYTEQVKAYRASLKSQ